VLVGSILGGVANCDQVCYHTTPIQSEPDGKASWRNLTTGGRSFPKRKFHTNALIRLVHETTHEQASAFGIRTRFEPVRENRSRCRTPNHILEPNNTHTFALVAKWTSPRTILAISALRDHELRHIDVETAFLNGPLDEKIYLRKPPEWVPAFGS
jgi:hypothetical protein